MRGKNQAGSLPRNPVYRFHGCTVIGIVTALMLLLSQPSFGDDFTARHLGDYGNVTVMEVSGNYDAEDSGGKVNASPRQAIAKEFFRIHKDEYDFLVIFTNFDFLMPAAEVRGFYLHVKNDVRGIGREIFDNSSLFGSSGNLQGTIDMGNIGTKVTDPLDPGFEGTLGLLSHEMLHRWSAYVRFKDWAGITSSALLGKGASHWSFLLDTKGSLQYGNQWHDNGNGTFTSLAVGKHYSPLDLYLMGMLDKSKVPPMLLIENPAIDPAQLPEEGVTVEGTPHSVSIEDIIAVEGERSPSAADAQKQFKTAFILAIAPGSFTGKELPGIENVRNGFVTRYSILTDGKGLVQVASTPRDDVPTNPGPPPPVIMPRILPPDINEGITWIVNNQQSDGSWTDLSLTTERDTAEAVSTLQYFPTAASQFNAGLQWLNRATSTNTDYLARKLDAVVRSGGDPGQLVAGLAALQNSDGGWGGGRSFLSSATDTALALKALLNAGYGDRESIGRSVTFLKGHQNSDGGWSDSGIVNGISTVQPTAAVVAAFVPLRNDFGLTEELNKGTTWLLTKQNSDGGFGNSPSTVYDTALALTALRAVGTDVLVTNRAVSYLLGQQQEDGSWNNSPFQTALAVRAVWQATITPDLSVKNSDITFIPERISEIPTTAVIQAVVSNLGRTDVPQAKVILYDGAVAPDKKVGEQVLAFPALSPVNVTFSVTIPDGKSHTFYLAVDPDNQVQESDETNNTAVKALLPELTYDIEVVPGSLTVSTNPADLYQDLKIGASLTNKGTSDAYNVQIRFFIDEAGAPHEIATITTDVPAGATISKEVTWKADKAGAEMPLTVQADPLDTFKEISETNNSASVPITVNGSTLPNLAISYKDIVISPNPSMEGGTSTISVIARNTGYGSASNVKLNFYKGVPENGGEFIGTSTITQLDPGMNETVSITWGPIADSGERIISIRIDPDNMVQEITKEDNDAFSTLEILSVPDLAISTNSVTLEPNAPKEGDPLAITVTVQNRGAQDAVNVPVRLEENGEVIGTQVMASVPGNSQAPVSFSYATSGRIGSHELRVSVDPDSALIELTKDNNIAVKTFAIQNANLWVSEPYFSPNGDGVKDTTDFFFRLAAPAKVKVQVVNRENEAVRTFAGGELDYTDGATITWDGLGDAGMVVADGEYRIRVVDSGNNILTELMVVVDTNRSPITEAIGTPYTLQNNLTYDMANVDIWNWEWYSDQSGLLMLVEPGGLNTTPYIDGVYNVSSLGDEIVRMIPWEWNYSDNPSTQYGDFERSISPDLEKIGISFWKCDKQEPYACVNEWWTAGRDGTNHKILYSEPVTGGYHFVRWSPDNRHLLSSGSGLFVMDSEEGSIVTIIGRGDVESYEWSPDGNGIAFYYPENGGYQLDVSDKTGNRKNIFTTSGYINRIIWVGNEKLVVEQYEPFGTVNLWMVDTTGGGNNAIIADTGRRYWEYIGDRSPDGNRYAFLEGSLGRIGDTQSVKVVDSTGAVTKISERTLSNGALDDLVPLSIEEPLQWSKSGNRVALVESSYRESEQKVYEDLLSHEFVNGTVTNKPMLSHPCDPRPDGQGELSCSGSHTWSLIISWLDEEANLLVESSDGLFVFNNETGDVSSTQSIDGFIEGVSPNRDMIMYTSDAGGEYDLWSLSSLLNLRAELNIKKNTSAIYLKGIAADRNFEGFRLEYASKENPDAWFQVMPPSDVPVINGDFIAWVPPGEGSYLVRLTVWDKAGNTAFTKKKVNWGQSSAISNLYKVNEIFSPNNDGVKDTVELYYKVLEPVHLEFVIHNENGNIVRTLTREHAEVGPQHVSWDGKDDKGNIVTEGRYSIRVFDYEFIVEVDVTPPDLEVSITAISKITYTDPFGFPVAVRYMSDLNGHVVDKNFKQWTYFYREGDNYKDWFKIKNSSFPLCKLTDNGNIIDDIISSFGIMKYTDSEGFLGSLENAVDKTYRLEGEDLAGNKKTMISNQMEETIFLLGWNRKILPSYIPSSWVRPQIHNLEWVETIRNELTQLNLQYRVLGDNTWHNGPPYRTYSPGRIVFDLDGTKIKDILSSVRLIAVDKNGTEYTSGTYSIDDIFEVDCNGTAVNFSYEKLKRFELQLLSNDDENYKDWTSIFVLDTMMGDKIPEGWVSLYGTIVMATRMDKNYQVRLRGYTYDNHTVYSKSVRLCKSGGGYLLKIDYISGECETKQKEAILSIHKKNHSYHVGGDVKYYIKKLDKYELLDGEKKGDNLLISTSNLEEGVYPTKAVITTFNLESGKIEEFEAYNNLIVDRVPPAVGITYPTGNALKLCPLRIDEPEGQWFAIAPEGTADDNYGVEKYELLYGVGESPTDWGPANTKYRNEENELEIVPITGNGKLRGPIGKWDLTGINDNINYRFQLKITDVTGNVSCGTSSAFRFDNSIDIPVLTLDKSLFSPNGDTILDQIYGTYRIDEPARVDVQTYKLVERPGLNPVLGDTPVKTLTSGLEHLSGTENTSWDGANEEGATVTDGNYGVAVFATDSCGNTNRKWVPVSVDNTPPAVSITFPKPGDSLPPGNLIEVAGAADDPHFASYTLEAGEGTSPESWQALFTGTSPVVTPHTLLGQWNTFGQEGVWTLRLTAVDNAGNRNSTISTIDLGERKTLIKTVQIAPQIFSPNGDQKLDTAAVTWETTDTCDIKLEIVNGTDAVIRTYQSAAQPAGAGSFVWDGKDKNAALVPDGSYAVRLTAALTANPSVTQTESLTVIVDTKPPVIDITQPGDNAFLNRTESPVFGSVTDPNITSYIINADGPEGPVTLDAGTQNREKYTFGALADLIEERYTITAEVRDAAENGTKVSRYFTIDRTAPKVTLDTPKAGEYYGTKTNVIDITGAIEEKNLERYSLRYGAGESPVEWKEVVGGDTVPETAKLHSWKVGKDDGVPDGVYTLSLHARDKAGLEGDARAKITIDNTLPVVKITAPKEGEYLKGPFDINGTLSDANLDKGTVEIAEGKCADASRWVTVKSLSTSVEDGVIANFAEIPPDGEYCLRLSATDKSGGTAEAKQNLTIDTTPPAAPVLTGKVADKTDGQLAWTKNSEPDLAGYNIYREKTKLNQDLLAGETYTDAGLKEGAYTYTVKAQDLAGNESEPSNALKLIVDATGPSVRIASPADGSRIGDLVDIKGTAFSSDDFKQYRISLGQGAAPASWTVIRTSPVPVTYGSLASWDTVSLPDGEIYTIKLEGEDLTGNVSTTQVSVTIDNAPPATPLLLSATPTVADVAVTWRANGEPDLAGYLLYRNDHLANAEGIVVGNLKPYLLGGTSYANIGLPDGKHFYSLFAMDQAGNISDQSNTITVELDNRRPHAVITEPADGAHIEAATLVRAESPDTDITTVLFQYRKAGDTAWTDLAPPVSTTPYFVHFDPKALGLEYGDYQIIATAADGTGPDPVPAFVTITYTDLTAPGAPVGLKAVTFGKTVSLSWTANTEEDLDGYSVYRTRGTVRTRVTSTLLKTPSCLDENLEDSDYSYDVTATDTYGNESKASDLAATKVYAPAVSQPYTPLGQANLTIKGNSAVANSSVAVTVDNSSGSTLGGQVVADDQGDFVFENLALDLGENRITASATDGSGNVSRQSEAIVVVYNETPSAPANLSVEPETNAVNLSWDSLNTDPEVAGYNVFRDDLKLNLPSAATAVSFNSSSYLTDWSFSPPIEYLASSAMDGNISTQWRPYSDEEIGTSHHWWEVTLPQAELINHLEIHWGTETDSEGNLIVHGAKDFEVQAWSGYAWIPIAKVIGNVTKDNNFDFKPSYRTDRIRIDITATMSGQIMLSEVGILKDNLVVPNSYRDETVKDNRYTYKVTAVDRYGFESVPSEEKTVEVGDVTPPAAPRNLTATVSNSDVSLDWSLTPNTEPDLAGYLVYRKEGEGWTRLNQEPMTATSHVDATLPNGTYMYHITAVDMVGNESAPSNEVSAEVFVTVLPPPANLTVTSPPEGGKLLIGWTAPEGGAQGYAVYRGTTTGGPYLKIQTTPGGILGLTDVPLANGTTYCYVVTSVDTVGNESVYSNEACGVPADTVAPGQPVITAPTVAGSPIVVDTPMTQVSGLADPEVVVELFRNGENVGRTTTANENVYVFDEYPLDHYVYNASLSPDGTRLAFVDDDNYYIWIRDLTSGTITRILQEEAESISWSPDGRSLAYSFWDTSNGDYRIAIYDTTTGTNSNLTDEQGVYEDNPNWFPDSTRVAYLGTKEGIASIWIKDIHSGETSLVISGENLSYPLLSPDGEKLSYYDSGRLEYIVLGDETSYFISDEAYWRSISWAPDGKKIAFSSFNDTWTIFSVKVFSLETNELSKLLESQQLARITTWSQSSDTVFFSILNVESGKYSISAVDMEGVSKTYRDGDWITYLAGTTGGFSYIDNQVFYLGSSMYPFTFEDAALDPDKNILHVVARDGSGNVSLPSEAISVTRRLEAVPDLSITGEDLLVYPPNPKPGEEVLVQATVKNIRTVDVSDVGVDLYLWDSSGELTMLKSEVIPQLAAGAESTLAVRLKTGMETGTNTIIAVVDPEDLVEELQEDNNFATREFLVTTQEGVVMSTTVDAPEYGSDRNVSIAVTINNAGNPVEGALEIAVEDGAGTRVALLDSRTLVLPYGGKEMLSPVWNTGATFAGNYQVHSVLAANSTVLAENRTPFVITPDIAVETKLTTDRTVYGPNENVIITVNTSNNGKNYIIPKLVAKVTVIDSAGNALFTDNRELFSLLPGANASLKSTWNTGLTVAGDYRAVLEVFIGETPLAAKEAGFTISATADLVGNIKAEPEVVSIGKNFIASFQVSNRGNSEAGGTLRVSLVEPATQAVISSYDRLLSLPANESLVGMYTFATEGLSPGNYLLTVLHVNGETVKTLSGAPVTVKDDIPPTVTILSPEGGKIYHGELGILSLVSDNASGIDKVEYRLDLGTWMLLPTMDPLKGKYGFIWDPGISGSGDHTLDVQAWDRAGNLSTPVSSTFTVQFDTVPPVLTVSTLSDGAVTNQETLNVSGKVTDDVGVREVSVNGDYVSVNADGNFSHAVLLTDGPNVITVMAYDLAGNEAKDVRTVHLDRDAPNLTVTAPPDDLKTGEEEVTVTGTVDESSTVEVALNGVSQYTVATTADFTTSVILQPDLNHIEVTAKDPASNATSVKRTVFFDNQKPTLAITEPSQDLKTNQPSIIIRGTVFDSQSPVSITFTMEGVTYTPPIVDGTFEQEVTFSEEMTYAVVVAATDGIDGHEVSAQRNIIYDVTKPVLTIDPVVSPTEEASQVVSGAREEGAQVTVTCPTATTGGTTYPTATTWSAPLTGLQLGENNVTASSTDEAGNETTATASIVVTSNEQEIVLIPFPNILWPPNHKMAPVMILGWIIKPCRSDIKSVTISVTDEYGKYNYSGLHFGSVVKLEAWRDGKDKDGRIYTVTAVATHKDGRKTTTTETVVVPHDMSKCSVKEGIMGIR